MEEKETYYSTTHKAEISRETRSAQADAQIERANHKIREAGKELAPFGCHYLGSACFHVYRDDVGNAWRFACQPLIGQAPEEAADFGWKELRKALMRFFGRPEPRTNSKV